MLICKAERIDGKGEVEGYLTYDIEYDKYRIRQKDGIGWRIHSINPQTLKYSFDGVSWYSESQMQNSLELLKDFDFKETTCNLGYLSNFPQVGRMKKNTTYTVHFIEELNND